jgi:hypothetical protein
MIFSKLKVFFTLGTLADNVEPGKIKNQPRIKTIAK